MKKISLMLSIIFSLALINSCEREREKKFFDKIPLEERFIFKKGDTLNYKCNNGSTFKVYIKDYKFWTETGTSQIGNTEWTSYIDFQTIILETLSNEWNIAFGSVFESNCFIIHTSGMPCDDNNRVTQITNGCELGGSIFVNAGCVIAQEITLNNRLYKKVYSFPKFNENYSLDICWNLKYGIILFESINEGTVLKWDLESPL